MILSRHSSLHKNGPTGLNALVTNTNASITIQRVSQSTVTSTVLDDRGSFPCKVTDTAGCNAFYTAGQAREAAHLDVVPMSTFTHILYAFSECCLGTVTYYSFVLVYLLILLSNKRILFVWHSTQLHKWKLCFGTVHSSGVQILSYCKMRLSLSGGLFLFLVFIHSRYTVIPRLTSYPANEFFG